MSMYGNEYQGLNTRRSSLSQRLRDSFRRKFGKKTIAEKFADRRKKASKAGFTKPKWNSTQFGGKRKRRKTRRKSKRTKRRSRRTRR